MRSLVIEDEPQIGAYLGRLLGQLRGIVDIVGSLSDAKQALGNFKYDLAILDRMLPDGDALDIVLALNKLPKRPAFIMLTAKDAKEDVIDGLNSGADDYLGKPFEPQEHQNVGLFDCDADRPDTDRTTGDIRRAGLRSFFDRDADVDSWSRSRDYRRDRGGGLVPRHSDYDSLDVTG